MIRVFLLACIVLVAAGCTPAVRSASFYDLPAKGADSTMPLFAFGEVTCPFEVVGSVIGVRGDQSDSTRTTEDVLSEMAGQARDMGGDAMLMNHRDRSGPVFSDGKWEMVGTVIRFTDSSCTR